MTKPATETLDVSAQRWNSLIPQLTLVLLTTLAAVGMTSTAAGNPLPGGGDEGTLALFTFLPPGVAAPAVAVLASIGALATALMMVALSPRRGRRGNSKPRGHRILPAVGVIVGVVMLTTIPGTGYLAYLGYLPMLVVGGFFDAEMRAALVNFDYLSLLLQTVAIVAGLGTLATRAIFGRAASGRCVRCGRDGSQSELATVEMASRWGRIATIVAVSIPLVYALTRYLWLVGIPLGIDDTFSESLGGQLIGAGLATCAVLGAWLTTGLVRPWGERFPRWMVGLVGKRVPISLAVVPGTAMSVIVCAAGLGMIAQLTLGTGIGMQKDIAENWAAFVPTLLWPLWGVALAAATFAYWVRRRGGCAVCGVDAVIR
ncbi:hypothetical protein LWF01_07605 [Saxibacter everestensis]|uniref:FtsX-like permease family protein n=1 Tax=Saxibacter everestensis TaxID=2909229 RepID=A0ABY8QX55_9MICO|nr:hypothetical protein LWF01_07605 [Brevibacteriaceae bacterium ZFBP1038]